MRKAISNRLTRIVAWSVAGAAILACWLTLPYGLYLISDQRNGAWLIAAGLVSGLVSIVSCVVARRLSVKRPAGPLADDAVNLMPPAIQRVPVGWTGYGASGTSSELPRSPQKP